MGPMGPISRKPPRLYSRRNCRTRARVPQGRASREARGGSKLQKAQRELREPQTLIPTLHVPVGNGAEVAGTSMQTPQGSRQRRPESKY
jgi:hypothetical protein